MNNYDLKPRDRRNGMAGRIARITWAITFVLILGFATGCTEEKQSQKPNGNYRIVTDCIGRKVRIPAHVHRVVDLALLDGTRTMVELGVSDKLVGVNDFVKNFMCGKDGEDFSCWFAAPKAAPQIKNLLSVGSCREPNVELLRSLAPDIILAYASYAELAIAVEKQTGVPVVCIRSSGCLDFEMLRLVGEIVGKQERAEELIAYAQSKIRSIAERVAQIPEDKRVKVFFWGWPVQDAPRTIAPYDPIDMAGGNQCGHAGRDKAL